MTIPEGALVVRYSELCDGHNILDTVFKGELDRFMRNNMPGGPMGLLCIDFGEERWEIQPDSHHVVKPVHWAPEDPEDVEESGYAIWNDNTSEWVSNQDYVMSCGDLSETTVISWDGEESVRAWEFKDDAEEQLAKLDSSYDAEHGHENRHGYPWAHSWWWLPEEFITDDQLKRAGFVVATYTGGNGNHREDEQFRLCGIDGGGYSFEGAHWSRLLAIVAVDREWQVETSRGRAYITFDYRTDLEKLAGETRDSVGD